MVLFEVCLSKTCCNDIPTEGTRRSQENGIASNLYSVRRDQILELVSIVGEKGYSFCPSTFTNAYKRKDTFKQTQLFALSFNNLSDNNTNLSFDSIVQRAKQYNLPIFFAYDIFSSFTWEPNHQQFCIVFLNEVPIFSLQEAETIQKALLTIFPEANRKHSSVTDLCFGGNSILYYDKTIPTINPDIVLVNMCLYLKNRYGATNYKRKIVSFAEDTGILLDDRKLPVVSLAEKLIISDERDTENKNH